MHCLLIYSAKNLKLTGRGSPFSLNLRGSAHFDRLTLLLLEGKDERFPDKPKCVFKINIGINSNRVTIRDNQGLCNHPDFETEAPIPDSL